MYRNTNLIFGKISADILIFDDLGFENLADLIKPYSYFIFNIRNVIYIDPFAILATIKFTISALHKKDFKARDLLKSFYIKQGLFGLLRIIKVIYISKFILRHRFTNIITFCDDSPYIGFLSFYLPDTIKIIAIQNGNRFYPNPFESSDTSDNWLGLTANHRLLLSFSTYEEKIYKADNFFAEKIIPFGSIRLADWIKKTQNLPKKEFDLCVVVTGSLDKKSYIKLALFISKLSLESELKICICLNFSKEVASSESNFIKYRNLFGHRVSYIFSAYGSTYTGVAKSDLVVSCFSSVMREALAIQVKIYPLNWDGKEYNGPYEGFIESGLVLDPEYKVFRSQVFELLRASWKDYFTKHMNVINEISALPAGADILKLREVIKKNLFSKRDLSK